MASPDVSTFTSEGGANLGTSNAMPLPTSSAAGDLIIALAVNDLGSTDITASTGWDAATQRGTTGLKSRVFARILTGTTGDNILSVSGTLTDYVVHMLRVPTGTHSVTNTATWLSSYTASAGAGSGVNPDPPNLAPGAGTQDYLWIVFVAIDATTTSDITADPSGYTLIDDVRSVTPATTSCVILRSSKLQNNASSENPGTATQATSVEWHAWTIGVPPVSPDATVNAGVITAVSAMQAPAAVSAGLTSNVITASSSMLVPTVVAAAIATPPTISAASAMQVPTISSGSATLGASVITATSAMQVPLVGEASTIVARSYVYLEEYIFDLPAITPGPADRVVHLSEQTGELTTLGADELEGWVNPTFPDPPEAGWPPGSWGGGGPGPDWEQPPFEPEEPPELPPGGGFEPPTDPPGAPGSPGGPTPVPDPPPWEEPPPDEDGEVPPDPGYPGELQQMNGGYIQWTARNALADADILPLSGLAAIPLRTQWYQVTGETPVYWADAGELEWEPSSEGYDPTLRPTQPGRQWSSGVLGGLPQSRAITFVFTLRPADRSDATDFTTAQFHLEARNEIWTVDAVASWGTGGRWLVKVFSKYFNGISPMSANPQSRIYEGHTGFEGGSEFGTPNIEAPSRYTSVIVLTTFYPYQPTGLWINQQDYSGTVTRYLEEEPMYSSEFSPVTSIDAVSPASCILQPGGGHTTNPPPNGVISNGIAAAAMYRGRPNANDLAVLQWRWGQ